jgi:four helix bundle protein
LLIAKASCGEVRSMLHLTVDLNYLNTEAEKRLIEKAKIISKSIASLIKHSNRK